MKSRTAEEERRSGIRWLIGGAFVLAAMIALWWLVATTNREGTHDAELLPLFALIPGLIGGCSYVTRRKRPSSYRKKSWRLALSPP